jgi:hypothetical protein
MSKHWIFLKLKAKHNLHLNPLGPFTHTFFMFLFIVKIYLALQLSTFNSIVIILIPHDDMFSPDLHFHQYQYCQTARLLVIFWVPCSFWKTRVPCICACKLLTEHLPNMVHITTWRFQWQFPSVSQEICCLLLA